MSIRDLISKGLSRVSTRPYWQVRYKDGRIVSEWEQDWSLIPRKGLLEVRLVCPNGKVAVLGLQGKDCSDRLFQFKVAKRTAGLSANPHTVEAYVIGVIYNTDGKSLCYAWEPEYVDQEGNIITTGRLVGPFDDNVWMMNYRLIGRINADVLGIGAGEGR